MKETSLTLAFKRKGTGTSALSLLLINMVI